MRYYALFYYINQKKCIKLCFIQNYIYISTLIIKKTNYEN